MDCNYFAQHYHKFVCAAHVRRGQVQESLVSKNATLRRDPLCMVQVGSGSHACTVPLVCVNTNGFARFPRRDA